MSAAHRALAGRWLVLILATGILGQGVTGPFSGYFEWNSAHYAYFARNHLDYGLGYTKLYCTHGHAKVPLEPPTRYINHPPLVCALPALAMLVFDDHEWVARGVAIASTLGSAWLVMTLVLRLQSLTLALLAGLFYVLLPITAYFGRMLDHVPLVQFFSLLMLHGYAQWEGLYGERYSRMRGAVAYGVGAVVGIATGWAAVIMAGLIGLWHLSRHGLRSSRHVTALLAALPAAALLIVLLHIAAAASWDLGYFRDLFLTRSVGARPEGPQPWSEWFGIQWSFLRANFSIFGILASALFVPLAGWIVHRTPTDSPYRRLVRSADSAVPLGLAAVQGIAYVLIFKNQSWTHEYWQYFGAPFVAASLATCVVGVGVVVERQGARVVGIVLASLLALAPLPGFLDSWRDYHERQHMPAEYLVVYDRLAERIPRKAPVLTWRDWASYEQSFGGYTHRWIQPQISYHADRPLIPTRDARAIAANREGAAAYVLERNQTEASARLEAWLRSRYETFEVGENHMVALLGSPRLAAPGP